MSLRKREDEEGGGRRRGGRRLALGSLWPVALAVVLLAAAGVGLLNWSRSPEGRSALLRRGADRFHGEVQGQVEGALAAVLPGYDPAAPAHEWPLGAAESRAAVRCRVLPAPEGLTLWETQERIAEALANRGAAVLWGERLQAAGPDGGELLRLDLGVPGRPTHTLLLHPADAEPPAVAWGATFAEDGSADERPAVAIVIDDWGYYQNESTRRLLELEAPLTLSVLPGLPFSRRFALAATEGEARPAALATAGQAASPRVAAAQRSGLQRRRRALGLPVEISLRPRTQAPAARRREVILHLPMEPDGYPEVDPGPGAILVGMDRLQIDAVLDEALAALPTVTGVSNHMGSRATADAATMRALMEALAARGLLFLDSLTSPRSVAVDEAERAGVAAAANRIFLDRDLAPEQIRANLRELVRVARATGTAVGIGHPNPQTAAVLAAELPRLAGEGVRLVTISELIAARAPARP